MEFLQSEKNAVRRRWILVLVDSTDGVTGKTGQTGTVEISKNGGAPAASTNSIVEVDSVNMPGHYYIELVAGELDTLGMISIYYKAASTLAFHDRGFVTYQDPFAATGGFVAPSNNTGLSITKAQSDDLLKKIRAMIAEEFAKYETEDDAEETAEVQKLDAILAAVTAPEPEEIPEEPFDYSPILDAIASIEKPKDYATDLSNIVQVLTELNSLRTVDSEGFSKIVVDFQTKMAVATKEINGSLEEVAAIKAGFADLQKLMDEFKTTLAEQSDMDKRFDSMNSAANNKKIEVLTEQMKQMMISLVNLKYDILKEVAKPKASPTKKK